MRYTFETNWTEERGYRVVDASDGGVVYANLSSSRDADIITRLLNEKAALLGEITALKAERDTLSTLCKRCDDGEWDIVENCAHNVRERDAHVGNPTCAHCSAADECTEVFPF